MLVEVLGNVVAAELLDEGDLLLGKLGRGDVIQITGLLEFQHALLQSLGDIAQLLTEGGDQGVDACLLLLGQRVGGNSRGIGLVGIGLAALLLLEEQGSFGVAESITEALARHGLGIGFEIDGSRCGQTAQRIGHEIQLDHVELDLGQIRTAEGVVPDLVELLTSDEATGQRRAVQEGLVGQPVKTGEHQGGISQGSAVGKCAIIQTEHLRQVTCEGNGGQLGAVLEAAFADVGNRTVEGHGSQAHAVHEDAIMEEGNGGGQNDILQCGAVVEEATAQHVVRNAVVECNGLQGCAVLEYTDAVQRGDALGNDNVDQTGACVHLLGEGGNTAEVNHGCQACTVLKEACADELEVGVSLRHGHGGQSGAVGKGTVTDEGNALGNVDGLQRYTTVKGILTDGLNGGGNDHGGQQLGILECAGGDLLDIVLRGNLNMGELRAGECTAQDHVNRLGQDVGLGRVGDGVVDQGIARLVQQCALTINEGFVCGIHRELGNTGAVGEGVTRHGGQSRGQVDGLDGYTILKCQLANGLQTGGQVDALQSRTTGEGLGVDGDQITRNRHVLQFRAAEERLSADDGYVLQIHGGDGGIAECVVTNGGNRGGEIDGGQGSSAVKCVGGDGGDPVVLGEDDSSQRRTACEGRGADGLYLRRDGDALEAHAVQERLLADGDDGGGDVDGLQLAVTGEQAGGNAGHCIGQMNLYQTSATGKHLITQGFQHITKDNDLQIRATAEQATANGSELTVGAEVYAFQCGTSGKGVITDEGYRVGNGDGGQALTVAEHTRSDGSDTLIECNVGQAGAAYKDLIGNARQGAGKGDGGQLGAGTEGLIVNGSGSFGNVQAGDSRAVEGLIANASQAVTLKCNGMQFGGTVEVEGLLTDGLQGCGEDDHFQSAIPESGFLDGLQGAGQLDELALELVECANLDGLNALGKLENTLVLNIGRAVEYGLAIQAVENAVLVLLHLCLTAREGDGFKVITVGKDGLTVGKEGGHAAGQLNRLQRIVMLEETCTHHGHGISDLEAFKGGISEGFCAEGGNLAVAPVKGGQLAADVEGLLLDDGNVVGNRKACQQATGEAIRCDQSHRRLNGQEQLGQILVSGECAGTHLLHQGQLQGLDCRVIVDGVVLESNGSCVDVELDDQLCGRLGSTVLGLAGLIQIVQSIAVNGIQMGGEFDVKKRGHVTDRTTDGSIFLAIHGDRIEGTDGQQRLAVVGIGLIKLLENDGGQIRTVEGTCANHIYVRGDSENTGLGSGTVGQQQIVAFCDGTDVQNTIERAVNTVVRMNVDFLQIQVALKDRINRVVVVGLVVFAQLLELRGEIDGGECTTCECALTDNQRIVGRAIDKANARQTNDTVVGVVLVHGRNLERVLTNVRDRAGEGHRSQGSALKGGITDDGQAILEIKGRQSRAALEGGGSNLTESAIGNGNSRQRGNVGECIRTNRLQIFGESYRGQLGVLKSTVAGNGIVGTDDQRRVTALEDQSCQLGACECTVADVGYGGGNGDRGQAGVSEGLGTDGGQGRR